MIHSRNICQKQKENNRKAPSETKHMWIDELCTVCSYGSYIVVHLAWLTQILNCIYVCIWINLYPPQHRSNSPERRTWTHAETPIPMTFNIFMVTNSIKFFPIWPLRSLRVCLSVCQRCEYQHERVSLWGSISFRLLIIKKNKPFLFLC